MVNLPVRMALGRQWQSLPSFSVALFVGLSLTLVSTANGQGMAWSPQRGGQPRSLAQLAADPNAAGPAIAAQPQMQQALLIRNPDPSDGTSEYALADQFGRVQRYVEESPGIDLASHVGERVTVRSDTGTTLLASQLNLVGTTSPSQQFPVMQAAHHYPTMQAAHQQPIAQRMQAGAPAHRVAQVAPVVVDDFGMVQGGMAGGGSMCNCPNCMASQQMMPSATGFVNAYDPCSSCSSCQNYSPYYMSQDNGFNPSCNRGSRGRFYGSAEYLLWWIDGMHTPPLVTGSPQGTPQAQAGVLGQPNTTVLFGDSYILDGSRDGLRFQAGSWFNDYQDLAIEGDVFFFETSSTAFSATGDNGFPILARPFFNMVPVDAFGDFLPPAEDAELVSYPNVVEGNVTVNARSEFGGAGLRLRAAICCKEIGATCTPCGPPTPPSAVSRIDVLGGYRYLSLQERLMITEDLTSLSTINPGSFDINDRFETSNEFHGGDVGFIWEWESTRFTLEFLSKLAIGSTRQKVTIDGSTTVSDGNNSFTEQGGLLALRSNIGDYDRNQFSVIPEIGLKAGYKVTPRLRATIGYTLIYWTNVARPGDQIDLDINPNLLPPIVEPVDGPERPRFIWDDSNLLAHGFNAGLDFRF
ncbi:BBP7 family outer membrane beta-barrel protein [Aeoliella sp. SH292]|uniref:BBP7 family outer membrane beta-barrel protein n=1 Tax=Aeoliella sp. SH292 TaxID=3454464 RepID=UPI003F977487